MQVEVSRFSPLLSRIRWWLFAFLVILAPFHAFSITWLKHILFFQQDWLVIISVWREMLVVLLCILIFIELLLRRKKVEFDGLDIAILAFGFLALAFLPFQWNEQYQWMLGVRFDVLPLIFLLFVRRVKWEHTDRLVRFALIAAAVVVIFGILQAAVLPKDFLVTFGYSQFPGFYRPDIPISACQYLEHTNAVCRAVSTFGGPTRYGTYLLLTLGLLFPFLKKKDWRMWTLLGLVGANIVLTYSRSIWIGLFIAAAIFALPFVNRGIRAVARYLGAALILILGFFAFLFAIQHPLGLEKIFLRFSSTEEHIRLLYEGISQSIAHPLGLGLGTVGPASLHFQKFLTENWFLQIAIEMGWLGLLLFLAILFLILKKLLSDKTDMRKLGLSLALFGIAIAGLFTHSFEETTTALLLFGFVGMELRKD